MSHDTEIDMLDMLNLTSDLFNWQAFKLNHWILSDFCPIFPIFVSKVFILANDFVKSLNYLLDFFL